MKRSLVQIALPLCLIFSSAAADERRGPRSALELLAPRSDALRGDIVEYVDAQQTEAEGLFALSEAAVYVVREGRVRLFLQGESSAALTPRARLNAIPSSMTLADFLAGLDRDLPGLLDGRQGRYLLKTPATVYGLETASSLPSRHSQPQYVSGTVFTDSFESSSLSTNWNLYGSSTAYGFASVSCEARSGIRSADAVRGGTSGQLLSCGSAYPDSVVTYMIHAACEDLLGAPQAWLDAYVHINTEVGYDYIGFFYPDPADPGIFYGYSYWGASNGWFHVAMNLRQFSWAGDLTQNPCNQVIVYFSSDSSAAPGFGARIDDLKIRTDTPSYR